MALKTTTPEGNSSGGTSPDSGSGSSSSPSKPNLGAIAGGAIGGIVAVALVLVGAEMLRRRRQGILRLFSHLKSPSSSGTPGEGGSPTELMEHNQVNRGPVLAGELQLYSCQVSQRPSASALREGGSLAELMAHAQACRGCVCTVELPAGEVAKEMDTKA